jgi:hypothetical protein
MSGPGYRISTADACPGVEKMLRQSTKSPKLSPNRSRPSPAYSYSTNSWGKKISKQVRPRSAPSHKRKHLTRRNAAHLALEEDLGLEATALLDGEHDPVRRQLHHRVLRLGGTGGSGFRARDGWEAGTGSGTGGKGGSEATDRRADLVSLPADGGERVDHAVDAVDLAYEVRRVIVATGHGRAHPRRPPGVAPSRCAFARLGACPPARFSFSRANEVKGPGPLASCWAQTHARLPDDGCWADDLPLSRPRRRSGWQPRPLHARR